MNRFFQLGLLIPEQSCIAGLIAETYGFICATTIGTHTANTVEVRAICTF